MICNNHDIEFIGINVKTNKFTYGCLNCGERITGDNIKVEFI